MINKPTHFGIYIDDMERATHFYKHVFDWAFNDYGPSDFQQIRSHESEDGELIGALQHRKYTPVKEKVIGFECTIGVSDLDSTIELVKEVGGEIIMPKTEIPNVGWITKFNDTEGNLVCAMQYNEHVLNAMNTN